MAARYYLPDGIAHKEENRLLGKLTCAECNERLATWMEADTKKRYLACHRQDRNGHDGVARAFVAPNEKEQIARREGNMAAVDQHRELATRGVPLTGLVTREQAIEILRTIYKGAPDPAIIKAAIICKDFGLHPLMKHVHLAPFKNQDGSTSWEVLLGIQATRKMMADKGSFSYVDNTPRLMTKQEQEAINGEVDGTRYWAITKLSTPSGLQAQGYGNWLKAKTVHGSDKGNTPQNMAQIRSERAAFGRLFPETRLPDVQLMDESYMPPVERVDVQTGEITEAVDPEAMPVIEQAAQPTEGTPEPTPAQSPAPAATKATPKAAAKQDMDCPFHPGTKAKYHSNAQGVVWYSHQFGEGEWCNLDSTGQKKAS